ncbi:polyphenol oxidase family protein [Nocardioides rubriscoriae]|uniref:polyphenol oxidase family protein n=1 Tax=Nocardioides rubriscoriae TaxID=642762 RepID=UPI0011DF38C1|nr:polyphenol oxidase family protein [Nocardioides rubriscoriae]
MYHHRSTLGPVELAFTDRHGGVSGAPFDSLNLAFFEDGERTVPQRNLALVLDDFAPGCEVADLSQVHGRHVVVAAPGEHRSEGDGIVTDRPDVVLLVRAADCVPVLLADPVAGVLGAAHAGRPGVAAGVVPATVEAMRDLGATDVTAWIGPHVCGACYEVPADLQAEVAAIVPATRATTSWGTPALDLGAGVRAQLEALDVRVVDVSACTRESPDLFSYRRDGADSGRLAGLIRRGVS